MSTIEFRPHGPHSDDYTTKASEAFYQAARTLSYATLGASGVTDPATVYAVVGNLDPGVYTLGQVLRQLGAFLDAEHAAGRLGDDHDPRRDPAETMARVHQRLTRAARAANDLSAELSNLHAALAGLHTRPDTATETEDML